MGKWQKQRMKNKKKDKWRMETATCLAELFQYRLWTDAQGNELVLLPDHEEIAGQTVGDKTAYEAINTHRHILEHIRKKQLPQAIAVGQVLGRAMLASLTQQFPDKQFRVYATVTLRDSLILRFHQIWPGEAPYYTPDENGPQYVFVFES